MCLLAWAYARAGFRTIGRRREAHRCGHAIVGRLTTTMVPAEAERYMFVDHRGVQLYVETHGAGQPLVLLHGLTSNLTALQPDIDYFSRSFRTIAIDSRGHGRSGKPVQYTLQDHVADVLHVLDVLELPTVFLQGASMGSYIAQGVAIAQPQRVRKLVLITPKAHRTSSSVARLIAQHAAELAGKSPEEVQAFVLANLFAPTTSTAARAAMAAFGQQQLELGLVLTPEQNRAANRALEDFDFRPRLPEITADTLVISGRHDPLNPPDEGQQITALVQHAQFVVLENSGHAPSVEEPEQLFSLIEAFLKR